MGPKTARRRALAAGLTLSLLAGPALAGGGAHARFAAIMDQVFGHGAWRMTGGYRTPAREAELRAQGAMTVRPGGVSRHSLGSPAAPGAYDLVVEGMSPYEAAARLRRAGAPFARYQPKGAHGTQGPHLHLEPYSLDLLATAPSIERPRDDGLPLVLAGLGRRREEPQAAPVAEEPGEPAEIAPPRRRVRRTAETGERRSCGSSASDGLPMVVAMSDACAFGPAPRGVVVVSASSDR